MDELLEKVNVITENDKVTIELTENSKDATITVMHGQTFGKCYSIHLADKIVAKGVSEIEFISRKLNTTYFYFHHPGQFFQKSRSKLYTIKGIFDDFLQLGGSPFFHLSYNFTCSLV